MKKKINREQEKFKKLLVNLDNYIYELEDTKDLKYIDYIKQDYEKAGFNTDIEFYDHHLFTLIDHWYTKKYQKKKIDKIILDFINNYCPEIKKKYMKQIEIINNQIN